MVPLQIYFAINEVKASFRTPPKGTVLITHSLDQGSYKLGILFLFISIQLFAFCSDLI